MIVAIVPAAGKSERMGRPKLLLPLGPRLVIEHVLDALAASQVDRTVVVLPPGLDELRAIVAARSVEIVQLTDATADMRATIEFGLARADSPLAGISSPPRMFLVAPADQPTVSARVIDQLIARSRHARGSIMIPTYRGQRGHPVLFDWKHAASVRAIPAGRGLNHLVAEFADQVEECAMDEPGLVEDLDTPADYERLVQRANCSR